MPSNKLLLYSTLARLERWSLKEQKRQEKIENGVEEEEERNTRKVWKTVANAHIDNFCIEPLFNTIFVGAIYRCHGENYHKL